MIKHPYKNNYSKDLDAFMVADSFEDWSIFVYDSDYTWTDYMIFLNDIFRNEE